MFRKESSLLGNADDRFTVSIATPRGILIRFYHPRTKYDVKLCFQGVCLLKGATPVSDPRFLPNLWTYVLSRGTSVSGTRSLLSLWSHVLSMGVPQSQLGVPQDRSPLPGTGVLLAGTGYPLDMTEILPSGTGVLPPGLEYPARTRYVMGSTPLAVSHGLSCLILMLL